MEKKLNAVFRTTSYTPGQQRGGWGGGEAEPSPWTAAVIQSEYWLYKNIYINFCNKIVLMDVNMQLRCGNRSLVLYYSACMTERISKDIQVLIIFKCMCVIGLVWSSWQWCVTRASESVWKAQRACGYTLKVPEQHWATRVSTLTGKTYSKHTNMQTTLNQTKVYRHTAMCTVHKKNIYNPAGFTHSQPRNIKNLYTAHIFFRKKKRVLGYIYMTTMY